MLAKFVGKYTDFPPITEWATPAIPLEEQIKIDQSKKILNIVLRDLDKFSPHEWQLAYQPIFGEDCRYQHECVSYSLFKYVRGGCGGYSPGITIENMSLTQEDSEFLCRAFFTERSSWNTIQTELESAKVLADFLNEDKRIICKTNTNDE